MFKRILIVGGLGLSGLVGLSGVVGVAGAQTTTTTQDARCYPVRTASCPAGLVISSVSARPGDSLTVTATGLDANTSATGQANSTPLALGTKTTTAAGSVSFTFTVPADFENGAHTVTVTGLKGGAATTLTVGFTVSGQTAGTTTTTAAPGGSSTSTSLGGTTTTARSGTNLPRTGDDSSVPMTQVGIGLLAVGGGVVYAAKRRRSANAAN